MLTKWQAATTRGSTLVSTFMLFPLEKADLMPRLLALEFPETERKLHSAHLDVDALNAAYALSLGIRLRW